MPKVELELELEQVARILEVLSPSELETLELLLNPELRTKLKRRWESARTELKEGKTLSKAELFSE